MAAEGRAMNMVLPKSIQASITRLSGGRARFRYTETFENAELVSRTAALAKDAFAKMGVSVSVSGKKITVRGVVPETMVADFMIGEFLCWDSSIGKATLVEMFRSVAIGVVLSNNKQVKDVLKGIGGEP